MTSHGVYITFRANGEEVETRKLQCVERFQNLVIEYDKMFHRTYKPPVPIRHERYGLGWLCELHQDSVYDHQVSIAFFFDEPDLLVQEMKAAEWVNKQTKKQAKERTDK